MVSVKRASQHANNQRDSLIRSGCIVVTVFPLDEPSLLPPLRADLSTLDVDVFLSPFLAVVRSEATTGPITGERNGTRCIVIHPHTRTHACMHACVRV